MPADGYLVVIGESVSPLLAIPALHPVSRIKLADLLDVQNKA